MSFDYGKHSCYQFISPDALPLVFASGVIDIFSNITADEILFNDNMTGHSLVDVFNQTGVVYTRTIGGFFKYSEIKGYDDAAKMNLLWTITGNGAGLIIGASGERDINPFYNYKK